MTNAVVAAGPAAVVAAVQRAFELRLDPALLGAVTAAGLVDEDGVPFVGGAVVAGVLVIAGAPHIYQVVVGDSK